VSGNVVALTRPADPDVVSLLEEALEAAKAGDLTAIVMIQVDPQGCAYANAGPMNRFEVLGYLSHLTHNLNDA